MAWMQPLVRRRGGGGRSAARLFRAALGQEPPRPARRTVERHLGWACRDPTQIGPTHALNPTAGGSSAPPAPAPRLLCRAWPPCRQGGGGRRGPRLAARAVLPALGGRAHPCARLGLAPVCVAALCWSPCGCGRAVGRVAGGVRWAPFVGFLVGWGCPVAGSALVVSRGGVVLAAPWWRRLVGSALWAGAFGRRPARSLVPWSWSGSRRSPPPPPSRRPGPAGSGSRWRFGGSLAGCGVSPCRWLSRRCSGWPLPPRCPPCRSGHGPLRSLGFSALARRRCRRAPVAGHQRRGLPLARWVLVTAPVLLPAIQTGAVSESRRA